jgi:hypothetical protein
MIPPIILPLVRRAILDLMNDIGGEHNEEVLTRLLGELGHRVARRDVAEQLGWLDVEGLVRSEQLGPFTVARILADGRDVADGRLTHEGVSKFKTGD